MKVIKSKAPDNSLLPLFAWAERRRVIPPNLTERVIAHRFCLSPTWSRLVCREAGLGGSSHE